MASGRSHTFFHALSFVAGFSLVFVLLGASVAFVGYTLNAYLPYIVKVGGILLVLFGLHVAGVWSAIARRIHESGNGDTPLGQLFLAFEEGLSRLMYTEGRPGMRSDARMSRPAGGGNLGYLSSVLMGVFFSAGWIPCVGPVLTAIYLMASDTQTVGQGALLLLVYSAGLGIPFLAAGAAFGRVTGWLRGLNRHLGLVGKITGLFLIVMGILLFTERMTMISIWFVSRFGTGLASLEPGGASAAITLPIAFLAGLLSFLSPCVLPLIPAYVGYLSGTAVAGAGKAAGANA